MDNQKNIQTPPVDGSKPELIADAKPTDSQGQEPVWENTDPQADSVPNIDPTVAFGKQADSDYDPQDDITENKAYKLIGRIQASNNIPAGNDTERVGIAEQAWDIGKGIVGGAIDGAIIAPGQLIDKLMYEAVKTIKPDYQAPTFKEDLDWHKYEKDAPVFFPDDGKEFVLPDWFHTETLAGDIASNLSQFAAGYAAISKLGILSKAGEAVNGMEGLTSISDRMWAAASNAAQMDLKAHLTDMVSFHGQQGNLANAIDAFTNHSNQLVNDVTKYAAVDGEDDELKARIKNGIAGTIGHIAVTPGMAAINVLKSSTRIAKFLANNEVVKKGTAAWKWLENEWQEQARHSQEFKEALDAAKNQKHDEALSSLFEGNAEHVAYLKKEYDRLVAEKGENDLQTQAIKQLYDAAKEFLDAEKLQKGQQEGQKVTISASQNDDGSIHVQVDGHEPTQTVTGWDVKDKKVKSKVETISQNDDPHDAAHKIINAYKNTPESFYADQLKALQDMLEQQAKQNARAFDKKGFQASVEAKIKAGEKIDIGQELRDAMGGKDLKDVDSYLKLWADVVNITTGSVKRYVSNPEQLQRVNNILGVGLGESNILDGEMMGGFNKLITGATEKITAIEQAAMDRIGLKLLSDHILGPKLFQLQVADFTALAKGDKTALASIRKEIRRVDPMYVQAKMVADEIMSSAGRLLQTGKIDPSSEDAQKFLATINATRKYRPLLTEGDMLSDRGLDIRSVIAKDINNQTDWSQLGAGEKASRLLRIATTAFGKGLVSSSRFTLGMGQELFYNGVLASLSTVKNIAWSSFANKEWQLASEGVGAALNRDMPSLKQTAAEQGAFLRYITEGITAGFTVLRTGAKNDLDWTPRHPHVISQEGLRQYFGKSAGDVLDDMWFGGNKTQRTAPGLFADRVTDLIGNVINIPTTNFIGGIDTAFRVANQRAMMHSELAAVADFRGLKGPAAKQFVEDNIDSVTHDLIVARNHNFKSGAPLTQKEFGLQQLQDLDDSLRTETGKSLFQIPLENSAYSDRRIFRTLNNVNKASRELGLVGTWELPFVKVFANVVQYGVDNTPGLAMLSEHNQAIARGEMGVRAKNQLAGRQILGGVLGLVGMGLSGKGLLTPYFGNVAPVAGSHGANKVNHQLKDEGIYTLNFPILGGKASTTINLSHLPGQADNLFLPAHFMNIAMGVANGTLDINSAAYAAISTGAEAFSTNKFIRGFSMGMDGLLNPSTKTFDNFTKGVLQSGAGMMFTPGGRVWDNFTQHTDPNYRDFSSPFNPVQGVADYISSKLPVTIRKEFPFLNQNPSPLYDPWGNPRPKLDYLGDTKNWALDMERAIMPYGISFHSNDPVAKELERFGANGKTITPPLKTMSVGGYNFPLDQYRKPDGTSLWDLYNQTFANTKLPSRNSDKKISIKDYLNEYVTSKEYNDPSMTDNSVSRLTGKSEVVEGDKWRELNRIYQQHKEDTKLLIFGDGNKNKGNYSALNEYRNFDGKSIMDVIRETERIQALQEKQGLMQSQQNQ